MEAQVLRKTWGCIHNFVDCHNKKLHAKKKQQQKLQLTTSKVKETTPIQSFREGACTLYGNNNVRLPSKFYKDLRTLI